MKSDAYWKRRAEQRMYEYIQEADRVADEVGKAYLQAAGYLEAQAKKIFDTYRKGGGLSEAEARRLLNDVGNATDYDALKKAYNRVKDPDMKQVLLNQLNAPAYRARIERLQQLREDLDRKCRELYKIETKAADEHLINTAQTAYYRTMYDIQRGTGYGFGFAQISEQGVNEILRNNWSGASYSSRIWSNTQTVAELIKNELFLGVLTGKSQHDMSAVIMEKMGVGAMQARRLVRTESCYVANQAEMESYKECEIEKYRFVATLDMRTSEICASLDGKEFPVDKQQPNVNCPPMHPNCRSTTIAVFDAEIMEGMQRRAVDPETGKDVFVPADMTYEEWKKRFVDKKKDGLAAKNSNNALGGKPERVGKIDFQDKDSITKILEDAEHKYSSYDYEVCMAITRDGGVWETQGLAGSVHPEQIETMENGTTLKGAYMYHNHPADQTFFSFSRYDVASFLDSEAELSYASDYKYKYYMHRIKETQKVKYDEVLEKFESIYYNDVYGLAITGELDIDEDGYHKTVEALSKQLKFAYRRILKDGQ